MPTFIPFVESTSTSPKRFLEHRRRTSGGSIHNLGGLVADFLEHPERYELPAGFIPTEERQRERKAQTSRERLRAEQEAQMQAEAHLEQLMGASPDDQWEAQRSTLQLLLKKHLDSGQWTQLGHLARSGEIQAVELTRLLVASKASSTLAEQVNQLKRRLNPLLPLT